MQGGFPSDNDNVNEVDSLKARSVYAQLSNTLESLNKKKIIFEKQESVNDTLLDESNIKELDS